MIMAFPGSLQFPFRCLISIDAWIVDGVMIKLDGKQNN